jgi:S-adenosylmethionine hydrolase
MNSERISVILTTNDQIVAVPENGDFSFAVFLDGVFKPKVDYIVAHYIC